MKSLTASLKILQIIDKFDSGTEGQGYTRFINSRNVVVTTERSEDVM